MAAKKSSNPINAEVNQNFVIQTVQFGTKKQQIVSAATFRKKVGENNAIKYFNKILKYDKAKYTFSMKEKYKITIWLR